MSERRPSGRRPATRVSGAHHHNSLDDLEARAAPLYSQALEQIEQEEQALQQLVHEHSGADVRLLIVIALVSLVVALGLYAFG